MNYDSSLLTSEKVTNKRTLMRKIPFTLLLWDIIRFSSILNICTLKLPFFHITLVYAEYWTQDGFQTICHKSCLYCTDKYEWNCETNWLTVILCCAIKQKEPWRLRRQRMRLIESEVKHKNINVNSLKNRDFSCPESAFGDAPQWTSMISLHIR